MTEATQQNPIAASDQFQLGIRLEGIFMPHARRQREKFYTGSSGIKPWARFVHYTSAESALKIIESKRVWMRNTMCMADYSEVMHGYYMLQRLLLAVEPRKKQFCDALDAIWPNVATEAIDLFNQWWANIRFSTYIVSISEHDDKEDLHGRLSMWRAFGGNVARVAVVLRLPWISAAPEVLNLMISPVAYLQEGEVQAVIEEVIGNIRTNGDFLLSVDRSLVARTVFMMLVAGVTCLKHEGFCEEREWRIIYVTNLFPSPLMQPSIEVVGGIPQMVYKPPLDVRVSDGLADLDLARMFDRLIVGPSEFSWSMYEAFTKALTAMGVEQAETRVCISGIPIRS